MKECCAAFYFCSLLVLTGNGEALVWNIYRDGKRQRHGGFRELGFVISLDIRQRISASINIIIFFISLGRSYFFQKEKTKKNLIRIYRSYILFRHDMIYLIGLDLQERDTRRLKVKSKKADWQLKPRILCKSATVI